MDDASEDDPEVARTRALLEWGDEVRRDLPWRGTRDPWLVLVSEVMLQQTQAERVVPKYRAFVERWPTASSCAEVELAAVLRLWSGLGYPRRARSLHLAAREIVSLHGGALPEDLDALLVLPGVGPYTARAVLVFAFEQEVGVVDTNVGRLLARWSGHTLTPAPAQSMADALVPRGQSWRWTQALFDLGASVCTKQAPSCDRCPVSSWCVWGGAADLEDPAIGSAGVSGRQAPFAGSDRQARGRLMRALAAGPLDVAGAAPAMGLPSDPARAVLLVQALIDDGLVRAEGGRLSLGG